MSAYEGYARFDEVIAQVMSQRADEFDELCKAYCDEIEEDMKSLKSFEELAGFYGPEIESQEDRAAVGCRHCHRWIELRDGVWVDPEATGDDSVWQATCDQHDTFDATHEPEEDQA